MPLFQVHLAFIWGSRVGCLQAPQHRVCFFPTGPSVEKSIENLVKWFWINTANILYGLASPKVESNLTSSYPIILPVVPKTVEIITHREHDFLSLPKPCVTQGIAGLTFSTSKARLFNLIFSSACSASFLSGQGSAHIQSASTMTATPSAHSSSWTSRTLEFVFQLQKYCWWGDMGLQHEPWLSLFSPALLKLSIQFSPH